ncbi:MAG: tRNA lysidine(34) synthetase TilS, partial [Deltaproteobacteria bacterium RIFCSPLOWO2_12_FULL_60_19]
IKGTIAKCQMFSRGDGVLVAVSGGPDSVALLNVLCELREEFGLRLEVAHVQHGIRGEEAREDARFVARMARQLGLAFHLKELNIPKLKAERGKGNLEAMAREARYGFFAEVAKQQGIQKIALGHTRDDQVETLLMWLLRGSGRKGLGGMAPVLKDEGGRMKAEVVRPLIETSREEIKAYLAAEALAYRTDRTNADTALLRNWIRLELLPQLRGKFGSDLHERLAHLADLMRDEEELLRGLAEGLLLEIVRQGELLREALVEQPKAMQRRLVRLWLEEKLGSLKGVEFEHVEEILRLISDGPPQGRVAIPQGREVVRRYDRVRLEKKSPGRRAVCYSYTLPVAGEVAIPEAGVKMASERCAMPIDLPSGDGKEALLDLSSLPEILTVRNFRNGDRFRPLGMRGHKKLKDLFIEKKAPLEVRAALPLLLAGDEILWIPGFGRSDVAKIGPATREVVRVRLSTLVKYNEVV